MKKIRPSATGASTLELALALPILLLLLAAIVDLAIFLVVKGSGESAILDAVSYISIRHGVEDAKLTPEPGDERETIGEIVEEVKARAVKKATLFIIKDYTEVPSTTPCKAIACLRDVHFYLDGTPLEDLDINDRKMNLRSLPIEGVLEIEYNSVTFFVLPYSTPFHIEAMVRGYQESPQNAALPHASDCNGIIGGPNVNCPCFNDPLDTKKTSPSVGVCICKPGVGLEKVNEQPNGTFDCRCIGAPTMVWNGTQCVCTDCTGDLIPTGNGCDCGCPNGYTRINGNQCDCQAPRVLNGEICECPASLPPCADGASRVGPDCHCACDDPNAVVCERDDICIVPTCSNNDFFDPVTCLCNPCADGETWCGHDESEGDVCFRDGSCSNGSLVMDNNTCVCSCPNGKTPCNGDCVDQCGDCYQEVLNDQCQCVPRSNTTGYDSCTRDEGQCVCTCNSGYEPFVDANGDTQCVPPCPAGTHRDGIPGHLECYCDACTIAGQSNNTTPFTGSELPNLNYCQCQCPIDDRNDCEESPGGVWTEETCSCSCSSSGTQLCDGICVSTSCSDPEKKEWDQGSCSCVCRTGYIPCGGQCEDPCTNPFLGYCDGSSFTCGCETDSTGAPTYQVECRGTCVDDCTRSGKVLDTDPLSSTYCDCLCPQSCTDGNRSVDSCECTCNGTDWYCEGACRDACPSGTYKNNNTCACSCLSGRSRCTDGSNRCLSCTGDFGTFNAAECECECSKICDTANGFELKDDCTCDCPDDYEVCNGRCVPSCTIEGQAPNPSENCACSECRSGQVSCQGSCVDACEEEGMQLDTGTCSCVCDSSTEFLCGGNCIDGSVRQACTDRGKIWNDQNCSCDCADDLEPCQNNQTRLEDCSCGCPDANLPRACDNRCYAECGDGFRVDDNCSCVCDHDGGICNTDPPRCVDPDSYCAGGLARLDTDTCQCTCPDASYSLEQCSPGSYSCQPRDCLPPKQRANPSNLCQECVCETSCAGSATQMDDCDCTCPEGYAYCPPNPAAGQGGGCRQPAFSCGRGQTPVCTDAGEVICPGTG